MGISTYKTIKEVRKALRMTLKQFGNKVNKAPSTISELESREAIGNITIKSLREMAEHLGWDFKYEFIPHKSIDDILFEQALKQVKIELGDAHQHIAADELETDAFHLLKESKKLKW